MVEVTRLNGSRFVLNGDMIEQIEAKPDTILSLSNGRKLIVRESVTEMIHKLLDYQRTLNAEPAIIGSAVSCAGVYHPLPDPV